MFTYCDILAELQLCGCWSTESKIFNQALASSSCFQSYLQKAIEECEGLSGDEDLADNVPLAVALASLLEGSWWIMSNFDFFE